MQVVKLLKSAVSVLRLLIAVDTVKYWRMNRMNIYCLHPQGCCGIIFNR